MPRSNTRTGMKTSTTSFVLLARDVQDLTAFGFDAAQYLEETDAATRRHTAHIALSGKATWKDAAELPLDWLWR